MYGCLCVQARYIALLDKATMPTLWSSRTRCLMAGDLPMKKRFKSSTAKRCTHRHRITGSFCSAMGACSIIWMAGIHLIRLQPGGRSWSSWVPWTRHSKRRSSSVKNCSMTSSHSISSWPNSSAASHNSIRSSVSMSSRPLHVEDVERFAFTGDFS